MYTMICIVPCRSENVLLTSLAVHAESEIISGLRLGFTLTQFDTVLRLAVVLVVSRTEFRRLVGTEGISLQNEL